MPIYEYQCHACGKVNELMQKIGADAPESCTACSGGPLSKLLSKTGFILKGSGWYVTDFRGGSGNNAKSAPAKDGSSDSGSKDSSSDSGSKDSGSSSSDSGTKTETKAAAAGGCATGCGHNH